MANTAPRLTAKQRAAVIHLARGLPVKAVGAAMGLKPKAGEFHCDVAKRKLGGLIPLVHYALHTGLVNNLWMAGE